MHGRIAVGVKALGADAGTHLAVNALGAKALRLIHLGPERAVRLCEQGHEGAHRAEARTPRAQYRQLENQEEWE